MAQRGCRPLRICWRGEQGTQGATDLLFLVLTHLWPPGASLFPGKVAGRKSLLVHIRDKEDVSILCACLSLADRECPLLGVAVLSHASGADLALFPSFTPHTWMDHRKHP